MLFSFFSKSTVCVRIWPNLVGTGQNRATYQSVGSRLQICLFCFSDFSCGGACSCLARKNAAHSVCEAAFYPGVTFALMPGLFSNEWHLQGGEPVVLQYGLSCTVDAQQLGPIVASRERLWLRLCAAAAPDWRTCACTGRRDSGPRCLWCGLMGRTGERVPQLCVSRIFDGRKPEEGTVKGKEKMGSMEKKCGGGDW